MKSKSVWLLVLAALLVSCASTARPTVTTERLEKGQVSFRALVQPTGNIPVKPFFAVSALNGLLESLDLLDLPLATKKELLDRLFAKIAYGPTDGALGELRVGGYFDGGSDLVMKLAVLTPGPQGRPPRADKVLVVQTNALWGKADAEGNRSVLKAFGVFANLDSNVSEVYLTFADGRLVQMNHVFDQELDDAFQKNRENPLNLVNMADTYLKDERLDNDAQVPAMLEQAYQSPQADASTKLVSRLNLALYWMSQNDLVQASSVLRQVQADTSPQRHQFASIIDRDAAEMIELQKQLTSP